MNEQKSGDSRMPRTQDKHGYPERGESPESDGHPGRSEVAQDDCHPERREGPALSSDLGKTLPAPQRETHPLTKLRQFTPARIALNRTGNSLPTRELLDFGLAHATARDAVHTALDVDGIAAQLTLAGIGSVRVRSAATDRATYLRRPDLGRRLDEFSRKSLTAPTATTRPDLVFVIADGLSALAPGRYAAPVIQATLKLLPGWRIGPAVIAEQARVALGDEIGELLGAETVVVLIGERPGLSSPDSLGIYMTYSPRQGRSDAERNCISNVRAEGMSIANAAKTLSYLLIQARRLQLSGVELKDDSGIEQPPRIEAREQRRIQST